MSNMKRGFGDGSNTGPMKRSRGDRPQARLMISSRVAGSIIGKGGSNIQKLRADNNATVRVPDCPGPERVMTIEAESEDILIAVIEQSLPLMSDEATRPRGGRDQNQGQNHEGGAELRMLVHQSQVGGVIGKAGYKIKEIREASGAHIKVFQTCAPQSTERVVSLTGTADQIVLAVKEVFKILNENEIKGVEHFYDPLNFDGFYGTEYGGYGGENDMGGNFGGPRGGGGGHRGGFGGPPPGAFNGPPGGFRGGRGGFGGPRGGFGGRGGFTPAFGGPEPNFGGFGKPFAGDDEEDSGETESTQVTIPKDTAGAIIGPGGSRIRKIRSDSRANISIDEAVTGNNERIITITGTKKQIEMAQYLLQQSVREHGTGAGGPPQQGYGGRGRY